MLRATTIYALMGLLHALTVFALPELADAPSPGDPLVRQWGYHFFAYLPLPVVLAAYGLFGVCLIPRVQAGVVSVLGALARRFRRVDRNVAFAAAGITGALLLWLLRQKYPFLGDGHVRAGELDHGVIHTSGSLYIRLVAAVAATFDLSGRKAYQVTSNFLGWPFIFLSLLVAREIGHDTLSRVASAVLIAGAGILQLYAGYIEVYAPLPVLLLLAVWLGLRGVRHLPSRWACLATVCAAVLVHPLGAVTLPAALVLVILPGPGVDARRVAILTAVAVVGCAGAWALDAFGRVGGVTLPLLPTHGRPYALVTATNLLERLNGLVLCVPAFVPLVILTRHRLGAAVARPRSRFLIVLSVSGLAALFVFDFVLGSLDWDLMAFVSFPTAILLAYALSRVPSGRLRAVAIPAITLTLLHTLSWIYVNHTDASVQRLGDIVLTEPAGYFNTHNRAVRVSLALHVEGLSDEAVRLLESETARLPGNRDITYNLASYLFDRKQYEDVIPVARRALEIQPWNVLAYAMLRTSLQNLDREEELNDLLRTHSETLVKRAREYYDDGDLNKAALMWGAAAFTDLQNPADLSDSEAALALLVEAHREKPELERPVPIRLLPEQMQTLARRAYATGNLRSAIRFWRTARRMGLDDPDLYWNLGVAEKEAGNPAAAGETWTEARRRHPEDERFPAGLALIRKALTAEKQGAGGL